MLVAVFTGGPRIDSMNTQYRELTLGLCHKQGFPMLMRTTLYVDDSPRARKLTHPTT
jgi:hypothetical protein